MTKKIAVISDIHGNYEALGKVIGDMEQFKVDEVYCLGDVISLGHQTNEVLSVLSEMENLTLITGNHDAEVIKALKGMKSQVSGPEHEHHLWVSRHIDPRYTHMLKNLP
ncbi:metallophosphoesterase family protein [Salinicoccus sp. CNSTN-B1]